MKTLAILYCLYDHQYFTPYNLEHIYDDVDQIIIAYGPFQYYKEIKNKILGYTDDYTLEIVKKFIKERDVENKIKLIIRDEWKNYHAKRVEVQKHIDCDWFFNIGPDEFFLDGSLRRAKEIINEYHDDINAVYHPRIEFCHDFHHYWGIDNLEINYNEVLDGNEYLLQKAHNEKQILKIGNYNILPFYNTTILWDPVDVSVIMTVSAYKYEEGLYWQKNDWEKFPPDAVLSHYEGTPFADLTTTYYDENIIRHDYPTMQEPQRHFIQRAIYYNKVRYPFRDTQDIIDEYTNKYTNWQEEEIKEIWFNTEKKIKEQGPIKYLGEYPTIIKHHPCFLN